MGATPLAADARQALRLRLLLARCWTQQQRLDEAEQHVRSARADEFQIGARADFLRHAPLHRPEEALMLALLSLAFVTATLPLMEVRSMSPRVDVIDSATTSP